MTHCAYRLSKQAITKITKETARALANTHTPQALITTSKHSVTGILHLTKRAAITGAHYNALKATTIGPSCYGGKDLVDEKPYPQNHNY